MSSLQCCSVGDNDERTHRYKADQRKAEGQKVVERIGVDLSIKLAGTEERSTGKQLARRAGGCGRVVHEKFVVVNLSAIV